MPEGYKNKLNQREKHQTKKRKDQNNCCSAEPKGYSGRLATDVRIRQKEVGTSNHFGATKTN